MVSYGLLNALLDFIGLASTVTVVVLLLSGLQPLFERVRDSCRACKPPEGRALLLWYALLIHVAWVAAAALYFRNLFALWDFMGTWLNQEPFNRPLYALLHFYLFFLLVFGIYAWTITFFEIAQNRQVFNDLFMIARFNTKKSQAIEDLEAQQRGSSSTGPIDAEAETPSATGDVRETSPLLQDEGSRGNGQERNEDVAPVERRINEPEHLTQEAATPRHGRPVGDISTWAIYSPIRSVPSSSWPTSGSCNNSETAGTSNQHRSILDSDGDTIISTSSASSSNASSGIDEPEYVDDDRYGIQGVRLAEPLENRTRRNANASYTINQRGYANHNDRDDSNDLYSATPRLSPQDQNAERYVERNDIGPLPSPCDSCSSTYAGSIPTVKRSPMRVPITPTSPTADADDADTEKTDIERKQRERKKRNSATSAPQSPHADATMSLPPFSTKIVLLGINPKRGNDAENTRALKANLAACALQQQRERTAASAPSSGKQQPPPSPTSAPAFSTRPATLPLNQGDREAGLFWRSREAVVNSGSGAAPRDVRFRLGAPPTRSHHSRRPQSPYPFAEGRPAAGAEEGRRPSELSLEIPDAGLDCHGWYRGL